MVFTFSWDDDVSWREGEKSMGKIERGNRWEDPKKKYEKTKKQR
jgi:hypothetical protein